MKQSTVNQSVARATGESVRRVRRMGFVLIPMPPLSTLPSPTSQTANNESANNEPLPRRA